MNDWKTLIGKQVKIFLNVNNIIYHGSITSVGEDYIKILDKYEKAVLIPISNILSVEEIGEVKKDEM